ncbi:LytR family transcriptional attenuator [Cytobacillus oceanisediminis]|uniref:LytR family transcriptional attenuator n=1 Tax=Cytobacillus oceanisediminis TaxID=665099 RepID=A0A2V3A3R8_9BACI|nr:LCP family protein [Cytobacillus oceanisediminis]PWW29436.1 LytR family transcriptional attenuator [Cytobacillus oceanisediminis]
MSNSRQQMKTQKKNRSRRRIFLWVMLPILILLVSTISYGAFLYNKAQSVMDESYVPIERESSKRETKADPHIDNISILFAGIDDSDKRNFSDASRTDALMLATFNDKQKSVKLLSIPRDSYVYIPNKGYDDKINHAYGKGGIASTIETVEELFDIPVDYYVNMNFNAFIDIVDALGGIEAEVPYALSEQDSQDRANAINLEPGIQELNGEEALALARTRKLDNDIERGKRQQEILKAIMNKAVSVKSVTRYSDVIEAVGDNMKTDLSFSEMKSFIDYATAGTGLSVETLNLPGQDSYINGIYYYQLDDAGLEDIKITLKDHLDLANQSLTGSNTESGTP